MNLSTTPHLRALRLDTIWGDKQALADLDSVLNTVQPLHKIVKMRITLHMSDHTPLSPIDTLDAGCTMLDPMIVEIAGIWRWERLSYNHPNQLHGCGVVLITVHLLLLVSLWLLRDFRCIQSTEVY